MTWGACGGRPKWVPGWLEESGIDMEGFFVGRTVREDSSTDVLVGVCVLESADRKMDERSVCRSNAQTNFE